MPTPKNLLGGQRGNRTNTTQESPVEPQAELFDDTPAAGGEVQLIERGGMSIPAIFDGLPTIADAPNVTTSKFAPYVACCSPIGKKYQEQRNAGCEDGAFYLAADGQFIPQNPMQYFLLSVSREYYTRADRSGAIVDAKLEKPDSDDDDNAEKYGAHVVAILLVINGQELIPAKAEFRGTRMGAIAPAIKECKMALLPEWQERGEDYKIACGYGTPLARVVAEARSTLKASKTSGQTMYIGTCVARPATMPQLAVFHRALQNTEFQAKVKLCKDAFREREREFDTMAAGNR